MQDTNNLSMRNKIFERGVPVIVLDVLRNELLRIVWEDTDLGVLICTEQGYQAFLESGEEPICVGFPKEDVRLAQPI